MADLFWAYWDATIRFALLASVLLILASFLKRMIPPRLLCWAWAILLLRLALPFSLPFSGSIFNAHESLQPSTWTETIRKGVVNAGFGETILPPLRDEDDIVIATRIPVSWETALMAVWLIGVAVMAGRLLANVIQLKRFFGRAERCEAGRLFEVFKDIKYRIGIYANVPLMISDHVKTPGIAGVFNPRIIVPRKCAEQLSDRELQCVFMHELNHYRRGDLFVHHGLLLLCYLHWYNPLVWLVLKQFKDEMEKACDLEVVDSVCSGSAQAYGYTLLQVLQFSRGEPYSPGGALSLLGSRNASALKERIALIAKKRRGRPLLTGVGLSIFASSFLFAMTGEVDPESESERLVKLTRISGPFAEHAVYDLEGIGFEGTIARDVLLDDERREWVQILEASKYAGKRIEVRTRVEISGENASCDLWASLDDIGDRSIEFHQSRMKGRMGDQETSVVVEVPKDAAKFKYGLTLMGTGSVWVSSLEIDVLDENLPTNESPRSAPKDLLEEAMDGAVLNVLKF